MDALTATLDRLIAERDQARAELAAARAAVAYRPGLPSVEQVRAHEARGGGWMVMISEGWVDFHGLRVYCGAVASYSKNQGAWKLEDRALWERVQLRPCLPDGTPCPWGDL